MDGLHNGLLLIHSVDTAWGVEGTPLKNDVSIIVSTAENPNEKRALTFIDVRPGERIGKLRPLETVYLQVSDDYKLTSHRNNSCLYLTAKELRIG